MPALDSTNKQDIRLLLLETPAKLESTQFLIESLGYTVVATDRQEEALERARAERFDLFLMNIDQNQLDGKPLLQHFKNEPDLSGIPLIVLSEFVEEKEIQIVKCIEAGVDELISYEMVEILCDSRIRATLKAKRLRDAEKEHLESIKEKNRALAELNEVKNRFVGMVAHDLRNPLGSIASLTELLLESRGELPWAEQQDLLQMIDSVCTDLLKLVHDILDVSVIESGNLELKYQLGGLDTLINERTRVFESIAAKKKIKLELQLQAPREFEFDRGKIVQVVDNLISNAIKFSPPDRTVFIGSTQINGTAKVHVKDQGPGLSPEDQGKLFVHFQKLTARPTAGESSTGLGLAIVRRMIEAHQGKLWVESTLGEGAVFLFELPMEREPSGSEA
jgi:two-component system, sensor histidine kinase and response regulator